MAHKTKGRIGIERYPEVLQMIAEGKTAGQIGDSMSVDHETVRKFARKRGIEISRKDMSGQHHPLWKGGTTLDRSGYILQRVALDGEYGYLIRAIQRRGKLGTDQSGYAPAHRIVMHDQLGRRLQAGEVVDHIDGDVTNNSPHNLRLFSSNAEHLKETLKGKVPRWSEAGKAKMTGRPPKNRKQDSLL